MGNYRVLRAICARLKVAFDLPSSSDSLRAAALVEVESRAYFGVFVYLSCWLGIGLSTGLVKTAPDHFTFVTYCFVTVAAFRMLLHFYFGRWVAYKLIVARLAFLTLVLSAGLILGVVTALTVLFEPLFPAFYPMIVVTGVLCTAGTLMLSIDPVIRYGMPVVMLSPVVFAFVIIPNAMNITLSILLLVNIAYLITTSRRSQLDYWNGMQARLLLAEQAALFEKQSLTDGLTQIPNRLNAQKRLSEEWDKLLQNDSTLTMMMVDIDHFKTVNDTYGHLFGDECLVAVAKTLSVIVREPNFVGRYGGEEFIIALCDVSEEEGMAIAEHLRNAVASIKLNVRERSINITCSIGMAAVRPPVRVTNVEAVVSLADAALYQAKEEGRNRVVSAMARPFL